MGHFIGYLQPLTEKNVATLGCLANKNRRMVMVDCFFAVHGNLVTKWQAKLPKVLQLNGGRNKCFNYLLMLVTNFCHSCFSFICLLFNFLLLHHARTKQHIKRSTRRTR
jgi:hypothetical protein